MAVSNIDFTSPNVQYTYDLSNNTIFEKNPENYINALGIQQLKTIGNSFLLDVYLSSGNVVEYHYHPNATEVLYCITGAITASLVNPFTKERKQFSLGSGQVVCFPQGWLHDAKATEDDTHLLAVHDTPELQTVWFSDLLRLLPAEQLAYMYCLNESEIKDALQPIHDTVVIGPPRNCERDRQFSGARSAHENMTFQRFPHNLDD
ncbi:cupin domain-containing protein [Virgibacillus siamensis]|uniref:cupin domain-containing protein n=1 Tax=Virgibacillus siamensis TaxID=480071 RepID=UPI000987A76A|nr:cupin domain-containing protein [Virgibacillus siamensis]